MLSLRPSNQADLAAITEIYGYNVRHGTGSFEETPPPLEELARRREDVLAKGLPHMVAELDGHVLGFADVNLYRPRSAYRFSLEDSIYVAPEAAGRGIGTRLLDDLIRQSTALGYRQMVAVIGDSANHGSIKLHAKAGFRHVGTIQSIGFKFDRWLDSVIMQRPLE
ncbi:MAG: hypothetical protein RL291_292 [Pseudomonadota bacterium]